MTGSLADLPRLHVVTDDSILSRSGLISTAEDLLEAGGPSVAFHVRGPHTMASTVYRVVSRLLDVAHGTGSVVVVNDRIDVALAAGAGAVHLGERSLATATARRLVGSRALIGRSTHGPADVRREVRAGVDYLFFGNVWATPSHPGREGAGRTGLRDAVEAADAVPIFAIGGVDVGRVPGVIDAGVRGVAVVRGVWDASDPAEAVSEYISALGR